MPLISSFLGFRVYLQYKDHERPHVHVWYGEYKASIDLFGKLLAGRLPAKQLRIIVGWISLHEDELRHCWQQAKNRQEIPKVPPLRRK